ncbi:MBG domain-containing protein, partial [Algoriphagus sp. PAP.12]|uniref:MBG domain-containing protein n=1 Tax=Algoriphagus sp. PAP.12 TaxID=2996678 RepID=UPI00227AC14D
LPGGTSVAYTNNGRTDVGTQEVTATITGSNYTTLELTADLTITAKEITVTADAGQSKIAGEADPTLTYTATGLAEGEGMEVFAGSLSRAAGEEVGMYAITQGTLSAGDNYTINFIGADFE